MKKSEPTIKELLKTEEELFKLQMELFTLREQIVELWSNTMKKRNETRLYRIELEKRRDLKKTRVKKRVQK